MKWQGKIAEVYDLWWSPNTEESVPFWCRATLQALCNQCRPEKTARIVELCSGTGRVLVPVVRHLLKELLDFHIEAIGLDYSPEMSAKLLEKLGDSERLKSAVRVMEVDIAQEDWTSALGPNPVDVFLFPFNHFAQMGSISIQEKLIGNITEHLALGGALILEDYNPQASRQRDTGEKSFRWMVADYAKNRTLYYWRQSWPVDPSHRLAQVLYLIECIECVDGRLRVEPLSATERIHYTSAEELDSLLNRHSLKVEARYGDYTGAPLTDACLNQLVVAKKK